MVGNRFQLTRRLGLALELRWVDPWVQTDDLTVHFYSPRRYGAVSVHAGFHVAFGPDFAKEPG